MDQRSAHISTRYRDHLLLGLGLGAWLYLFLALIAPFDAATLPLKIRIFLMIGYGVVFCLMYLACIPIQNWWYQRKGSWGWRDESAFVALFCIVCLPACYRYYITDWVNGDWGFTRFSLEIFLPTLVVVVPALIMSRHYLLRRLVSPANDMLKPLQLSGDNKLDVLHLQAEQLIALSAANNYVSVHYWDGDSNSKKLLRTTLKKLQTEVPHLVRVHRSWLVNPIHFQEWKDGATLIVGPLEVPVSKTYKLQLQEAQLFVPK